MEILIENVGKRYRRGLWALRQFSLKLGPGVFGLLGPNGAGKSTLMRILATITDATEGRIIWNSTDIAKKPDELRQVLGYLPQEFGVYPHLNAIEFLTYIAAVKGLDGRAARHRIDELIQLVNLGGAAKRSMGGYSGGMKQRVGIAQALLNDPQLLIVDEPTAGLDPEERMRFRALLAELSGARIVLLSTHIVSDVEATATSVGIISKGRLIIHDLPEGLLRSVQGKVWTRTISSQEIPVLREKCLITGTARRSDGVHVRMVAEHRPDPQAVPVAETLEDAYLYQVGANELALGTRGME